MKFALSAVIALLAAGPVSAAMVTEYVHVTQYVYQDVNVYVDENGNPVTTVSSLVSTTEVVGDAAPEATPADDTVQHSHAADPTTYASVNNNYQYQPTTSETPAPAPAPTTEAPAPAPTTEAPAPAPAPTTSETPAPAPVPTTTSEAPASAPVTTSSAAPAPTSGSGSGESFSGDATYYAPGLGACGETNSESDFIAALNVAQFNSFGAMSNGNPVCGKKATISRNGKSVTVTITDKCPGCKFGDLDLSPAAFDAIASEAEGRVPITWSFDS